jgi:transposase
MPLRVFVTRGTEADCRYAGKLMAGMKAEHLLADRGYDSNAVISEAQAAGMCAVIPSKRNRRIPRPYDKGLYAVRHLVENAFLYLKYWRSIATRYAKNIASFLAAVQIRCIAIWMKVL